MRGARRRIATATGANLTGALGFVARPLRTHARLDRNMARTV